jgi:hypothetical protein
MKKLAGFPVDRELGAIHLAIIRSAPVAAATRSCDKSHRGWQLDRLFPIYRPGRSNRRQRSARHQS